MGRLVVLTSSVITAVRSDEQGQDLAEYALLIGLISLIAVVAVTFLGSQISEVFSGIAAQVGGWTPEGTPYPCSPWPDCG